MLDTRSISPACNTITYARVINSCMDCTMCPSTRWQALFSMTTIVFVMFIKELSASCVCACVHACMHAYHVQITYNIKSLHIGRAGNVHLSLVHHNSGENDNLNLRNKILTEACMMEDVINNGNNTISLYLYCSFNCQMPRPLCL